MTSREFDQLNEQMLERFFGINPDQATAYGKHDPYDGELPHGGVKRLQENLKLSYEWEKRSSGLANKGDFSEDQEISLEVLKMCVKLNEFALKDFEIWRMHPDALEMPGSVLFLMLSREYAPYEKRAAWMSSRIGQLPRYMAEFRSRFKDGRPVKAWAKLALVTCRGFPEFLTFIEEHSKGKMPAKEHALLSKNVSEATSALAEHLRWLERLHDGAHSESAMGKKNLDKLLKIRGFEMTADEMLALAEKGIREMKVERRESAKRLSPGNPDRALRMIRDDSPATFDLALKETEKEMLKARKWIVDNAVCTVDYKGKVLVKETPPFMRSGVTTAAMFMPAVFDKEPNGLYMMTRPESEEDMKHLNNRSGIVNTTVHEAYPGHFHQGAMSIKKPWMHQLHHMMTTPDSMVVAYETMEGWAHYCEKMMFDRGYEATEAGYYTMLDFAIWRACRVVHDIKLCRGDASLEDMVTFFMRETDSSRETAEGDVVGFSRTPSYALSYFTGRHLVFELLDDLKRKLGKKFDEKRFHDLLAINGNLPFYLAERAVRAGMA